jgi:hypothetical protein
MVFTVHLLQELVMRALVVAGKAVVKIDQVRRKSLFRAQGTEEALLSEFWRVEIDNIFKGNLGIRVANMLVSMGIETTLVLAKDGVHGSEINSQITLKTFRTFTDEIPRFVNFSFVYSSFSYMSAEMSSSFCFVVSCNEATICFETCFAIWFQTS